MTRIVDRVTLIFTYISAVLFAVIVVIVLCNIIGRAMFNTPIKGTVELVQYGVMLCAGFVMCRSGFEDKHITVSVLIDKFPRIGHDAFVAIGKLFGVVLFSVLSYMNYQNIPVAIAQNKLTDAFRAPFQYIYMAMAVCFAIGALVFLYQLIAGIAKIARGGAEK